MHVSPINRLLATYASLFCCRNPRLQCNAFILYKVLLLLIIVAIIDTLRPYNIYDCIVGVSDAKDNGNDKVEKHIIIIYVYRICVTAVFNRTNLQRALIERASMT